MKGSLRRLILIATIVVALVTVVVTAIAGLQLVRTADTSEARASLSLRIDRLASAAPATREAVVTGLSDLDDPSGLVAVIDADGTVRGSAAFVVPERVVQSVRAGSTVSTTVHRDGESYLVEARPATGGGAVVAAQDLSKVRPVSGAVLTRLLVALGIGFAVAVVVAILAARRLSRPLTRVATVARELAAGRRDVSFAPSGIDEVRDVEAALETLASALARSEGRQREFLLSISHELRTPLTAIRGYSEALRDGLIGADRLPEVAETIDSEASRLAAFTDDLLALARLEADDFSVHPLAVDVAEIVEAAARAWRAAADTAGVGLIVEAAPVTIVTDPGRVRQLVDGLVENALRVSPAGTAIVLRAIPGLDGGCVLDVTDAGPGLTADDAAHAFERGVLRERYRDVRRVGTGLGLSIAARLAERLGATITAHPGTEVGTVFCISLPATPGSYSFDDQTRINA